MISPAATPKPKRGGVAASAVSAATARTIAATRTLARRTPVEAAAATSVLGPDDLLMTWPKPVWSKNLSYSHEEWLALPEDLKLRQIKVTITAPGMRNQSFYLVTTLTDASRYTAAELADLYFQRSVVVAEYAEILKHSYWAQDGSMEAVYREASRIYDSMPRERDMEEFVDLVGKALRLSE